MHLGFRRKQKCKHQWKKLKDGTKITEETEYGVRKQPYVVDRCMRCGETRERHWGYGYMDDHSPLRPYWESKNASPNRMPEFKEELKRMGG